MPFPANPTEARQNDLEMARRKAEETAARLRGAPRASYPGQPASAQPGATSGQGYGQAAANAAQGAARAAQAPATAPSTAQVKPGPDARGYAPAMKPAQMPATRPAQAQPYRAPAGVDPARGTQAVLGVTGRAVGRADDAQAERNASEQRRQRLRGELRMQAFKLARPDASPVELDLARRGR